MWETKFFRKLVDKFFFNVVDACEYGSMHKKGPAFLSNFFALRLQKRCTGTHVHKEWKVQRTDSGEWRFDTAAEAEYPSILAREIAASFMEQLLPTGLFSIQDGLGDHAARLGSASQPRHTRGPLLLSEFKTKVQITCTAADEPPEFIPEAASAPWQGVPVGAKRLDIQPIAVEKGEVGWLRVTYGVYFNPKEFVDKALTLHEAPF